MFVVAQDATTADQFPLRADGEGGVGLRAQSVPLSLLGSCSGGSRLCVRSYMLIACEGRGTEMGLKLTAQGLIQRAWCTTGNAPKSNSSTH